MVSLQLGFLQGQRQNKNMLDLKLSFILNDGMMIECGTKLFTQHKYGINNEKNIMLTKLLLACEKVAYKVGHLLMNN